MTVSGRTYRSDLLVLPDRVLPRWRRAVGHRLGSGDLEDILEPGLETVVIGTGAFGRMAVPGEPRKDLEGRGLKVHALPTAEAVKLFNGEVRRGGRTAGAFHLTC